MQASALITHSPSSPSFNSYSSKIAARVVQEFADDQSDIIPWTDTSPGHEHNTTQNVNDEEQADADEDSEFAFVFPNAVTNSSPISADEIFYNGQIRPTYPLFDTSLLDAPSNKITTSISVSTNSNSSKDLPKKSSPSSRLPLRKLFKEENERETASCSSSEADLDDELENLPAGSYCVWAPQKTPQRISICAKKSSSTGTSKRWKFRDLLYRSSSDGTDTFVFMTQTGKNNICNNDNNKAIKGGGGGVVQEHYAKNSRDLGVKEGDKRRSFLPYRKDLVGLFSNGDGLSRNLHPF